MFEEIREFFPKILRRDFFFKKKERKKDRLKGIIKQK